MEFQLPNAFGKSRHGQPTHIRYSIPSTVISKLRLLYGFLKQNLLQLRPKLITEHQAGHRKLVLLVV
jgi:hypothetical protein